MVRKVIVMYNVFDEICEFSSKYANFRMPRERWVECMGYLFCKREGDEYIVADAVGMISGSDMYVEMTPEELASIERLEKERPGLFLGGWFHTHPGLTPFYSDTDVQNQSFYQQYNEDGLGIVFDLNMVSEDFIGFKIFRNDSKNAKTYHEVSYELRDFTEDKLRQALEKLGGYPKWLIHNLAVYLGLSDQALIKKELPNINNLLKDSGKLSEESALEEGDKYFKKAKVYQFKRDFNSAFENMYLAAEFYHLADEIEMCLDSILDAIGYLAKTDYTFLMEDIEAHYKEIAEELDKESANYYMGKLMVSISDLKREEGNLTFAVEYLKKGVSYFDPDEDYEEIFDCYDKMSEAYKSMNALTERKKVLEHALKFAALAEKEANSGEDEDEAEEITRNWNKIINDLRAELERLEKETKGAGLQRII
ncbi:MAG: Mov34/MPN/PAD-1 family protein [Promethearchaeota archaeon]